MMIEDLGLKKTTLKKLKALGFNTVGQLIDHALKPCMDGRPRRGIIFVLALTGIGKESYFDIHDRLEHQLDCKFKYR